MARAALDFIFMFTHADETVGDCLEVFETAARAGVKHMGFKDLGVPYEILVELNRRIKAAGAVSYFEVVRSEEHTSELQSLMRISYAVFCLKKKNDNITAMYKQFFNSTIIQLLSIRQ